MPDTPLPAPRRLTTPDRDELAARHRRHDRRTVIWLALEVAAAVGCLVWVRAGGGPSATVETAVLVGVAVIGLFDALPWLWAASRTRLRDLRPEARFGVHSRDSLLACVDRVRARLGIPGECPVSLVRDKDINAHAVPLSLLPGIGSLAEVRLNRSILHLFDEPELESVIGHEFGHVFAFAPLAGRCLFVHAAFAAALTLAIAHVLAGSEVRFGAPLLALWPARWLAFSTTLTRARATEFLCDDYGAAAAGTGPAMRAELKIALETEARATLVEQVLEARLRGGDVALPTLLAAYEAALPFGTVTPRETEATLRGELERLRRDAEGFSLGGLWRHLFSGDDVDEDSLRGSVASGRACRAVARVTVRPQDVLAGKTTLASCVAAIEAEPTRVLFHLPDEIDDSDSSHPNCSRRLLFLWRSRDAAAETTGARTAAS
ncbi:MAG: M48 family metalloprotease [Planctomycetaceae bacterium]